MGCKFDPFRAPISKTCHSDPRNGHGSGITVMRQLYCCRGQRTARRQKRLLDVGRLLRRSPPTVWAIHAARALRCMPEPDRNARRATEVLNLWTRCPESHGVVDALVGRRLACL